MKGWGFIGFKIRLNIQINVEQKLANHWSVKTINILYTLPLKIFVIIL